MTGTAFSELHSPRLTLRRLLPSDGEAIRAYRSLPEVARYQSWTAFTRADVARLLAEQVALEPETPGSWFQLAIVETESAAVIGDCGIHFCADDARQAEVGITLAPSRQGSGLANEAMSRVLSYLFDGLNKHRVFAITDAENKAAARLFQRLGFRREGHFVEHVWFKGAYGSEYLFALLRCEWKGARVLVQSDLPDRR